MYVRFMPKMKLSCHYRSDRVPFVKKTRQDNDVTNRTGAVYVENDIELSWLIGLGATMMKTR